MPKEEIYIMMKKYFDDIQSGKIKPKYYSIFIPKECRDILIKEMERHNLN